MARMEMDCTVFFKFITFCNGKLATTQIMVTSFFNNSLDIFLLVFYTHSMYDKGTYFLFSVAVTSTVKIFIACLLFKPRQNHSYGYKFYFIFI